MTHITLPRATVEQALEAMRCAVPTGKITLADWHKSIAELEAVLAQQVKHVAWMRPWPPVRAQQAEPVEEPVYWEVRCTAHPKWVRVDEQQFDEYVAHGWEGQKLYTAPPQRQPLTDEDILRVLMLDPPNPSLWPHLKGEAIVGDVQQAVLAIVRAVERAHGIEEKNRGR